MIKSSVFLAICFFCYALSIPVPVDRVNVTITMESLNVTILESDPIQDARGTTLTDP